MRRDDPIADLRDRSGRADHKRGECRALADCSGTKAAAAKALGLTISLPLVGNETNRVTREVRNWGTEWVCRQT